MNCLPYDNKKIIVSLEIKKKKKMFQLRLQDKDRLDVWCVLVRS